MLVLYSG
ncbi:hypothetical protein F383_24361 [Gossypium arboreum]|nr:hypothetical protein F383_24361 [Gossypium arboreum]